MENLRWLHLHNAYKAFVPVLANIKHSITGFAYPFLCELSMILWGLVRKCWLKCFGDVQGGCDMFLLWFYRGNRQPFPLQVSPWTSPPPSRAPLPPSGSGSKLRSQAGPATVQSLVIPYWNNGIVPWVGLWLLTWCLIRYTKLMSHIWKLFITKGLR